MSDDKDTNVADFDKIEPSKRFTPQAYGGCTCMCHDPNGPVVMHCMPCCYPTEDDVVDIFIPDEDES